MPRSGTVSGGEGQNPRPSERGACQSASGYDASGPGRLVQRNNVFTGSGTCETNGTVTEPRTYYSYTLDPANNVPALVRAGAGVGKIGA